ncbi:MAG: cupin domain-containing protein [Chloroflexi bacterium]|nr:cupin domain-containing protein [Chloroflexota bacterium]MBI3734635.1 cupin domain-containing protein [Chloroflexota bacterium]
MEAFDLFALVAERDTSAARYREFLRKPSLSAGLYTLPAGAADRQQPHQEDEVYYVMRGQGMIRVGEEDRAVAPGTFVFVAARVPHHFHNIREDLAILVLFAPAESAPTSSNA